MGKDIVGIKKISAMEKNLTNVNTRLKNLYGDLKQVHDSLDSFIRGDGTTAYWNGTDAQEWFVKAIKNHNNNIVDYQSAYTFASTMDTQLIATKAISRQKSGKKH